MAEKPIRRDALALAPLPAVSEHDCVADEMPEEKPLRSMSFAVHATRGLIRDQAARRKTMTVLLAIALVLLLAGSTFLAPILNPREHFGWTLTFWIICIWLTLTALLLALFDLLMLRAAGRSEARRLRRPND